MSFLQPSIFIISCIKFTFIAVVWPCGKKSYLMSSYIHRCCCNWIYSSVSSCRITKWNHCISLIQSDCRVRGRADLFLLSLSYRETFFIATSWLKTFSFTSESSSNNNKSRCETFVAFSFYESFIMNNKMDFWT